MALCTTSKWTSALSRVSFKVEIQHQWYHELLCRTVHSTSFSCFIQTKHYISLSMQKMTNEKKKKNYFYVNYWIRTISELLAPSILLRLLRGAFWVSDYSTLARFCSIFLCALLLIWPVYFPLDCFYCNWFCRVFWDHVATMVILSFKMSWNWNICKTVSCFHKTSKVNKRVERF